MTLTELREARAAKINEARTLLANETLTPSRKPRSTNSRLKSPAWKPTNSVRSSLKTRSAAH